MLSNKENIDPDGLTGILKNSQSEDDTVPATNILVGLDDDTLDTTRFRRRVSFAPEVTLHKIDLVSQRRKTIGAVESVSSDTKSSQDSHEPVNTISEPVDSSDIEGEEMELTEQLQPVRETDLDLEGFVDATEYNNEETMEFTQPISAIGKYSTSIHDLSVISEETHMEEEMESTQPISKIVTEGPLAHPDSQLEEMEQTQPLSRLVESYTLSQKSMSQITDDMEQTQALSSIQQAPVPVAPASQEMEQTQPLSTIQIAVPIMEQTQPLSSIQPEPEMEQTQPLSSIQADAPEMEQTEALSSIQPEPEMQAGPKKPSNRSTMEGEFSDVEIPIPSELSNKRFSDANDVPELKKRKVSLSPEPEQYLNHQNVTLSQFLNDLGVKFFDDVELDDVATEQLDKTLLEQGHAFAEYVKANNKMLVYSLYEFSNKDLSKNIMEGRKLYDQLNYSILENNPILLKEFYSVTASEQESMKSEFSLIQEYCKFEAQETWYKWRIQLVENLIIKLDNKYSNLLEDKVKLESNIQAIDQEIDNKLQELKGLKDKSLLLLKIKDRYKDSAEEFNAFKTQLSESKRDILKLKADVESKTQELSLLVKQSEDYTTVIKHLQEDINTQQQQLDKHRKFTIHDIRLLNFNFKLLQELTGMKYIGRDNDVMTFEYKEYRFSIGEKLSFDVLEERLFNPWIYQHIIKTFDSLQGTTLEQLQQAKTIIDNFTKIDKEIFKISIKVPTTYIEAGEEVFAFSVRFTKYNEFKVFLNFTISLSDLRDTENKPLAFKLNCETVKAYKDMETQEILGDLKTQCHISNDILNNVLC